MIEFARAKWRVNPEMVAVAAVEFVGVDARETATAAGAAGEAQLN